MKPHHLTGLLGILLIGSPLLGVPLLGATTSSAAPAPHDSPAAKQEAEKLAKLPPVVPGSVDQSGRKQKGGASYYAKHFNQKKMANGNRFNPNSNVAASKTLPLGTTAKVTNVTNGKSAVVTVEDRGPFVKGRVVDLTPKVADQLDMRKAGVAPVVVAPIAVPQRDGGVKLGAGAAEATPHEVAVATEIADAAR